MKRMTLIGFIATGLLAASSAHAVWGEGNPDVYGTVLNDAPKPAFVGTSLGMARTRHDIYQGFVRGNGDIDQSGHLAGTAPAEGFGPWGHGNVDAYGSVLPGR